MFCDAVTLSMFLFPNVEETTLEQPLRKADKGGEENISGDGITLEVAKMAVNDPLDLDAGGRVAYPQNWKQMLKKGREQSEMDWAK
eukprot:g31721.t1